MLIMRNFANRILKDPVCKRQFDLQISVLFVRFGKMKCNLPVISFIFSVSPIPNTAVTYTMSASFPHVNRNAGINGASQVNAQLFTFLALKIGKSKCNLNTGLCTV